VNVGKPKRIHRVEPLKDPVPARRRPEKPPAAPRVPSKVGRA
jgi:hypothetical protein